MRTDHAGRRDLLRAAAGLAAFQRRVRGANDRISLAFIGPGVMGTENLGVAARQPGVTVSAVCDVYQPNLERAPWRAGRGTRRRNCATSAKS